MVVAMSASTPGNENWEDETMMTRRCLLIDTAVGFAAASIDPQWLAVARSETCEVMSRDDEWRKLLTPEQFAVLRMSATERPFTSALLHEKRRGNFACAGCELDLFSSTTKYDSGTGWPGFWTPIEGAAGPTEDTSFGMVRDEVHCSRCGGHQGHGLN